MILWAGQAEAWDWLTIREGVLTISSRARMMPAIAMRCPARPSENYLRSLPINVHEAIRKRIGRPRK